MATQDSTEIPFTSALHRQAFKLLELPAELLELLESENPPTLVSASIVVHSMLTDSRLHLRNAESTSGATYALLSTPSKTYRVQQKNTSNPIMILKPSTTSALNDAEGSENANDIPLPSMCSIATVEDTLELLPEETQKVEKKVNKWHEKFAKSRTASKG